jgi:6-phosphogluconolactonase
MKVNLRAVCLASVSLLALTGFGCGGGNMPPGSGANSACVTSATPEYAYMLNIGTAIGAEGDSVSMYTVNSCTGALTPTAPAVVATGSSPNQPGSEQMVVDPLGRFAYVANLISNATDQATISMYTINSGSGVLTPTTPATVPTGFFPQGITIDPLGRFLYTGNSDDNSISMFTINPSTGILTPTAPASVATGKSPIGVMIDPTGRFAYSVSQDDDTVSMYTVNQSTGVLTPMTPATVGTGESPFGLAIDPTGKFAYVANAYAPATSLSLSQYTINPVSGVLTADTPSYVAAGQDTTAVAVDPSGKFAYATNRLDGTVSMFTINSSTGTLSSNGVVAAGTEPFQIAFDPSGKFVYVANEGSAASVYEMNSDGTLAQIYADETGSGALSIAVTSVK